MAHTCHVIGCAVDVWPKHLMCLTHWNQVPIALQAEIYQMYRAGQERDKNPSKAWLKAAFAAINFIARLEGQPERRLPDEEDL